MGVPAKEGQQPRRWPLWEVRRGPNYATHCQAANRWQRPLPHVGGTQLRGSSSALTHASAKHRLGTLDTGREEPLPPRGPPHIPSLRDVLLRTCPRGLRRERPPASSLGAGAAGTSEAGEGLGSVWAAMGTATADKVSQAKLSG